MGRYKKHLFRTSKSKLGHHYVGTIFDVLLQGIQPTTPVAFLEGKLNKYCRLVFAEECTVQLESCLQY